MISILFLCYSGTLFVASLSIKHARLLQTYIKNFTRTVAISNKEIHG